MSEHAGIAGLEFDWFAIDRAGNIAMFSTAGSGFVPENVVCGRAEHWETACSLPAPHWGSDKVWDDYAALGFFVYDWGVDGGPYRRLRVPSGEITERLREKLVSLVSIPRLEIEFHKCRSLSEGELEQGTASSGNPMSP